MAAPENSLGTSRLYDNAIWLVQSHWWDTQGSGGLWHHIPHQRSPALCLLSRKRPWLFAPFPRQTRSVCTQKQ